MAVAAPERGLVIAYSYLWHSEYRRGREEGVKHRPCVIVISVEAGPAGRVVTVVPVTHKAPIGADDAVEIPAATKRRLRLDEERSWIVVSEVNQFSWPGPDLRPAGADRFAYGFLPPVLFDEVRLKLRAHVAGRRLRITPRTK